MSTIRPGAPARILGAAGGRCDARRLPCPRSSVTRCAGLARPAQGPRSATVRTTWSPSLEAFLVSLSTVALAEVGDRTQILSLMLAARFRRPWPILGGVLCATLANHAIAALVGAHLGGLLTPVVRNAAVGASLLLMALWALKSDELEQSRAAGRSRSAFTVTVVTFFIAEMGDKTQIATMALAAAYSNTAVVVAGTTTGMMLANAPVVLLGRWFSARLPVKAIHRVASLLFLALGVVFLIRAARHAP